MRKNPLLVLSIIVVAAAAVVIGSCSWETPEEIVFRAQPQVWIPTGEALFDLDISEDITDEFVQSVTAADTKLSAGEKEDGFDPYGLYYEGKPLTLYAELEITAPTFPGAPPVTDFDVLLEGQTDPIDLSEVSGPIPDEVQLKQVPGWAWFVPGSTPPTDPVYVRLEARWTDGGAQTQYLLGTSSSFEILASSQVSANTFNELTAVFNARPADLVLHYEFGVKSGDSDKIAELHVRLEVPFAFEVTAPALLDFEEDGENPLAMEEDVFGRDPAEPDEDLDELLESLRGSSAGIRFDLTHKTGLGAHLGMIDSTDSLSDAEKKDTTNWVIHVEIQPNESKQDIDVDISAQVLDWMIDGVDPDELPPDPPDGQFVPEFLVLLEEDFQINRDWNLTVTDGYLHVQTVFDYSFSLEDDE